MDAIDVPVGSRIRAFDLCQNQWPWMTLKIIMHSASKHVRLSEPTMKIWMKIDDKIGDDDVAQWL